MDEHRRALDIAEGHLDRMHGSFRSTASPDIVCSTLPPHWRSNKSLPNQFSVLIFYPVPDGTKVSIAAGNEENPWADIKNNVAEVQQQIARFSDLRFVGKSGRGKNFNLTITIHTRPMKEVAIVAGIIKVTVDGPRDSRNPNNKMIVDRKRPGDPLHHYMPPFLPLKQQRLMPHFPLLSPSIGPQHLQAALHVAKTVSPIQPPLSQVLSWPSLYESYKSMMNGGVGPGRLPLGFPPNDFFQSNPMLMQQLNTMRCLRDLIVGTTGPSNEKCTIGGGNQDTRKSSTEGEVKNPRIRKEEEERHSECPIRKLPASFKLPSPCFQTPKTEDASRSSDESGDGSKPPKLHKADVRSPDETFSTSNASLSKDDDLPIDVETTTDDDDEHTESINDEHSKKMKPVIKLWRPYTPPTSTSPRASILR